MASGWSSWMRQAGPPSRRELAQDVVGAIIAIIVGTIVAAVVERTADRSTVILLAGISSAVTYIVIDRLMRGRLPAIYGRPIKHSVPNAIGLFTAMLLTTVQSLPISVVFPTAVTMIFVGNVASDYLWAREESRHHA